MGRFLNRFQPFNAGVVELVDTSDSKSDARKSVSVQVRPSVPLICKSPPQHAAKGWYNDPDCQTIPEYRRAAIKPRLIRLEHRLLTVKLDYSSSPRDCFYYSLHRAHQSCYFPRDGLFWRPVNGAKAFGANTGQSSQATPELLPKIGVRQ